MLMSRWMYRKIISLNQSYLELMQVTEQVLFESYMQFIDDAFLAAAN